MARPQKKGLDYFPLDVSMDKTDDDIQILEAKHGIEGFCILIKLYMKIYQDEGYFIKWGEKESLLHSKRVNVDINSVNEVINDLVEWDVFNKEIFMEYSIITSKRIQDTYIEAVKKRKSVDMIDALIVTDRINSNINLVNSDIYPQRKEKKRIVKNSKEQCQSKWTDDDVEYKLSKYLFNHVVRNNPNAKEPNLQKWSDHIDKMIRLDKREPEEIKRVIKWCQDDDFWMGNILSTDKLRKKYDQLILKVNKPNSKPKEKNVGGVDDYYAT